uniref:Uncharacterized protein n=1 Tax=Anopheles quadriannulatus TaxID=34691 RepID=A0A182XRC7_ANOQN
MRQCVKLSIVAFSLHTVEKMIDRFDRTSAPNHQPGQPILWVATVDLLLGTVVQQCMSVCSSEAERIDRYQRSSKRSALVYHLQLSVQQRGHIGTGLGVVNVRRNDTVLHRNDTLCDGADPGSRFRMANVRLDRTDQQWFGSVRTEHLLDSVTLFRITNYGAGAVRFHVADVFRIIGHLGVELIEQLLLDLVRRESDALELVPIAVGFRVDHVSVDTLCILRLLE